MIKKTLHILLLLLLTGFKQVQVQEEMPTEAEEYALKAVFIYNFSRYVEWLPSAMATNETGEFVIGIVGSSPIISPLVEIAGSKTAKGKKIIIRQFYSTEDIRYCHILFIPKKTFSSLDDILSRVSKGTLTVSEREGGAHEGVAFNFVIIENKLKFEANTKAITSAGLKASSELLKLAIII